MCRLKSGIRSFTWWCLQIGHTKSTGSGQMKLGSTCIEREGVRMLVVYALEGFHSGRSSEDCFTFNFRDDLEFDFDFDFDLDCFSA